MQAEGEGGRQGGEDLSKTGKGKIGWVLREDWKRDIERRSGKLREDLETVGWGLNN